MRRSPHVLAALLCVVAVLTSCAATVDGQAQRGTFIPTVREPDPAMRISGIVVDTDQEIRHVPPGQRVAYGYEPPMGGRHDRVWADCDGAVYDTGVRTEHMVHSLEHGAVWIAYDPKRIAGEDLELLVQRVRGRTYLMLSPYPGLDRPISLQSWGHQLKVSDPDDRRIDQFIGALRANPYTHPEPGATCSANPALFDVDDPPPFGT